MMTRGGTVNAQVAEPGDAASLAGQFQLRCRELIGEIKTLGFAPAGWIGRINSHGAVEAAKLLISSHEILPVTRWLVERGHSELTMEREISQARWHDLFTDAERSEAAHRLSMIGRERTNL